ncbi:hypothetical protein [Pseudoduganella sp. HUAS MS19]
MANGKQASARRVKMAERAQQQMDLHFPGMPDAWLWTRKKNDGFTTMPRTMPLVMQAIDEQSKGQPAGHALFCLWARSPDHPMLVIENPATFASEAGFVGIRAVDTWRRRMKVLRDLLFIRAEPGPSGDFHYVLLTNPNAAMENLKVAGKIQTGLYSRFLDRLAEVGAMGELDELRQFWATAAAASAATTPSPPATPDSTPATSPTPAAQTTSQSGD